MTTFYKFIDCQANVEARVTQQRKEYATVQKLNQLILAHHTKVRDVLPLISFCRKKVQIPRNKNEVGKNGTLKNAV